MTTYWNEAKETLKKIIINTNQEFITSDTATETAFQNRTAELLSELDIAVEFDDIGTTYSWKDVSEGIGTDEGFWIQEILERAWSETHS